MAKARVYVRDNLGRFASTGATARGARLKTASGAKRKGGESMKAKGAVRVGTVGKAGQKGSAPKLKPQEKGSVRKNPASLDFDTLKRRYDRTRPENGGLSNNVDDRDRSGYSQTGRTKLLNSMSTRARALKVYRQEASRPLHELSSETVRAPYGRFSVVKNPAPAKAFPSAAPGRTKKGELAARAARTAAKASKKRRR